MEQSVEVILKETITETVNVDEALAGRVRTLVEKALDTAEFVLEFGMMEQRMLLIRTLLTASTKTLGRDFTTKENEARIALDRMFKTMREPEVSYAAPIAALAPRIDDSDEGTDH